MFTAAHPSFSTTPKPFREGCALQAKLVVGQVNDRLEHEADRVADQVMRTPASGPYVTGALPQVSRKCAACEEDSEEQQLQTKSGTAGVRSDAAPQLVHEVLRSPGQPIDSASRTFFEPRFGKDFSQVRVHTDERAAESARSVGARAYTVGQQVVFGHGLYAPHTADGQRLLAHELTHTLQQRGHSGSLQRQPNPPELATHDHPSLGTRLKILEDTAPAARSRLDQIIRTGGPVPTQTRVIGAAIIDIKGYDGPKEMRAISGAATDPLGQGAPVYHASSPNVRTLSATRGIRAPGPRREFPFSHINDAEMKLFEDIIGRLPKDPEGVIHFTTMRVRQVNGQAAFEAYPACSGCIRASFETAGALPTIDLVSHAPVQPSGTADLGPPSPPQTADTARKPGGGPKVKEERGAPVEPVVEATPGYRPEKGTGIGGAFIILQAMQFSGLQRAEVDKFQERLDELQPKIQAFLDKGNSVELLLIVEKPNATDFFCAAGTFCDQGQLVYFHDLFINYVESVQPLRPVFSPPPVRSYPTMDSPGGRSGYVPYVHEGGSLIDLKEIPYLKTRDPEHHCEYGRLTLYPPIRADFPLVPQQPKKLQKPKPRLDPAARKALADAPAEVYVESENILQYKTAVEVIKKLHGNPLFGTVKDDIGGGFGRTRTIVSYPSELDKPKAEALVKILRSAGVPTAYSQINGAGDGDPGVLTIWFGKDAEK
jgi:Domain of unknown function (DUF4157)